MGQNKSCLAFFLAGTSELERQARCRELQALALLLFGHRHPVTIALGEAVSDPNATNRALGLIDTAPALTKRRLLASYAALLPRGRP